MRLSRHVAIGIMLVSPCAFADDTEREKSARELYERGAHQYADKSYEQAVDSFKSSYALSARAQLLYNIALAYEEWAGHCVPAKEFYRQYLDKKPDAKDRDEVTGRIGRLLELCPDPPPQVVTPPPPPPTREARGPLKTTKLNVVPIFGIGAGVFIAAAGGVLVGASGAQYASLQSSCPCPPETWQSWRAIDYAGDAMLIAGGAIALASIAWFAIVPKRVMVSPALDGLVVSGNF